MPVSAQTPIQSYPGNGATTLFAYSFMVLLASDLVVLVNDAAGVSHLKTLNVDYTVAGLSGASGSVTFVTAPIVGETVVVYRDSGLARTTDYQEDGDLLAATLDNDFDRLWMALQEIYNGGKGEPTAIRVPNGETIPALGNAAARANKTLGFDSSGDPTVLTPVAGSAASVLTDLASTANVALGPSLVGYGPDLVYAHGTVGSKLRERRSIFDFMSAAQEADVVSGTNALDLASVFTAAQAWASGLGRPAAIVFPNYKYKASAYPNWNISGLWLETIGTPELICTGAGPILNFDGTAAWIYFVRVGDFILTGNAACVYGMQTIRVAHGSFGKIRVRNVLTCAFQVASNVCCVFDSPECSINTDTMTTIPARGMRLTSAVGTSTTACIIRNPVMEGVTQGLDIPEADFCVIDGGTAEACTVRGINIGPLSKGIRIIRMACEANTTEDVLDQGIDTLIEGGYFTKLINQTGAVRPVVRSVRCQSITADAATTGPTYEYIRYSAFAAAGAITVNAAVTKITSRKNYNINTNTWANFGVREWANPTTLFASITPGASPYTYTNSSDFAEQIIVRNNIGTVSRVDAIDTGANVSVAGGAQGLTAPNVYWVMPGEGLKVTYAGGAIEMIRLPR